MEDFLTDYWWLIVLYSLYIIPIKGWALWRAARREEKGWFIALLIVNTAGILELIYIFGISKDKETSN